MRRDHDSFIRARPNREGLFKLLEILGESAWELDLGTQQSRSSLEFCKSLGYDPTLMPLTSERALGLLHPDDVILASEEVRLYLESEDPFELEIRVRAADGDWRFIRFRGCVTERSDTGRPLVIGGIIDDLTKDVVVAQTEFDAKKLISTLSNREQQVFGCLIAGAANKNIAYGLGISQRTVEGYRARLMEKLGVKSVGELVQIAIVGGVTSESAENCGLAVVNEHAPPNPSSAGPATAGYSPD